MRKELEQQERPLGFFAFCPQCPHIIYMYGIIADAEIKNPT
jgi:hypothetical protein